MKLHLPLGLLSAVLACFSAVASHTLAVEESININFVANDGQKLTDGLGADVSGQTVYWNQFVGANGSTDAEDAIYEYDGTSTELVNVGINWSSNNTWSCSASNPLLVGYLDDGGSGITINVTGLDYLTYDVYIYAATDNGTSFTSKRVNGISYTADGTEAAEVGSENWGTPGTRDSVGIGTNVLWVTGQTDETLTIQSSGASNQNRGCIAAIQIVNTYAGTKYAATLGSTTADWTENALGGEAWSDSDVTSGGSYASLTLTEGTDTTLTIKGETDSTRNTDAIFVSGGNLTISGGTLELTGVGRLSVQEDRVLTINSTLRGENGLTKTGVGTLVLAQRTSYTGDTTISGGTLKVTADGAQTGFAGGDVIVEAGGTLWLTKTDNLGWSDNCTPNIILRGEENNVARMQVDERQTTTTTISMEGNAEISGSATNSQIQTYGATDGSTPLITAINAGNVISTKLSIDHNVAIQVGALPSDEVTTDNSELTLSGQVTGYNGGGKTLTKTGLGTLILTQAAPNDNVSYTVNGGTLRVTVADNGGSAFTRKDLNINAGGTVLLEKVDGMGYNANRIDNITLTGAEGNVATLKLGGRQTMQTHITMAGHALIASADATADNLTLGTGTNAPSLNPLSNNNGSGSITVRNTNNVISTDIALRSNLTIEVEAAGELTFTGGFFNQEAGSTFITKTGEGTMMIGAEGNTDTTLATIANGHGLKLTAGELVNNRYLSVENLTVEEGSTFTNNGALTLTGVVTLGTAITNSSTGTLTFSDTATLDVGHMEGVTSGNTVTYTIANSAVTWESVSENKLLNITMEGKTWDFSALATNGTFSYTLAAQNLQCNDGTLTWTTGGTVGDGTFYSGDMVTFLGNSTATLGDNVTSSGITVANGATATIAEGEAEGNRVLSTDSVTVEAGGSLLLSGSAMLDTPHLTVEGAVVEDGVQVTEAGRLIMSGTELASGTKVHGTGILELNISGTQTYTSVVDEFEGDLVIASGTYRHSVGGEWDTLNSIVVTGTGTAEFFGQGTGGDYTGSIVVENLAEGHTDALRLDGGEVRGTVKITGDATIYNNWDGELYSAINGEGNLTLEVGQYGGMSIGSDFSGLTGDIIVETHQNHSATFKGTLNGVQGEHDGSSAGVELKANIANTGKFIVKQGTANVHSAIASTNGVEVQSGGVLNVNNADQAKNFTLKGGTVNLTGSTLNAVQEGGISLDGGNSVISGNQAGIKAAITGTGNLTLKANNNPLHVYSDTSFVGDLSVSAGTVNLGSSAQANTHIHNDGHINITGATASTNNGAKLENTKDVNITSGSLTVNNGTTVNNGGDINVRGGHLTLNAGAVVGSMVAVQTAVQAEDGTQSYATKASISADATYSNIKVEQSAISRATEGSVASISNADIALMDDYSISNVTLENINFTATEGAGFTATGTTLTGTNSLTMIGDTIAMTGTTITVETLGSMELSGSLEFGLSDSLITSVYNRLNVGEQLTISLALSFAETPAEASTFALTTPDVTVSEAMAERFGDYELELAETGVNIIFAAKAPATIPEPATATLSLLALAALAARRRRK